MRSKFSLLLFLFIFAAFMSVFFGCDDLVTEVNNITLKDSTLGQDCLTGCHSDNNSQIVQPRGQWENSDHSSPELIEADVTLNGVVFSTNKCGEQCHTNEGFIEAFKDGLGVPGNTSDQFQPSVIGCYTCHEAHTADYGEWSLDELRGYDPEVILILNNGSAFPFGKSKQCAHCHQVPEAPDFAGDVTLAGDWGPHFSPQADVMSGTGGYQFGLVGDDIVTHEATQHGLSTKDGCLACHFGDGVGYEFGEHTFRLTNDVGVQHLQNCMQSNCHATGSVTDLFGDSIITAIATNGFLLKNNLKSRGFLEADGISTPTGTIVPKRAAQILYNYLMYEHDGSVGVHNPKFMDTLLEMSLAAWDSIPPEAAFSVSDTLVCAGTPITFTNESVGDDVEWAWDFGDDGTSTDENPTYTYNAAGLYTVSFTAKSLAGDNDGADIVTKTDLINVLGLPDADFAVEGDTTGDCTMEVVFVDSSTNVDPATHGVVTYFWEFGDGATDTVPSPSHTYQVPFGTTDTLRYEVSLTVTTDCGSDTETRTDYIVMRPGAPVAGISVSPSNIGPVVNPFSFTAVSPGATSWLWDFGDGVGTSTESNPDYTFSTANDYWVKLTVSNLCGEDTDSVLVTAE